MEFSYIHFLLEVYYFKSKLNIYFKEFSLIDWTKQLCTKQNKPLIMFCI